MQTKETEQSPGKSMWEIKFQSSKFQKKTKKLTTPFDPKPYKVIAVKGTMVTAKRQDHKITRNFVALQNNQ